MSHEFSQHSKSILHMAQPFDLLSTTTDVLQLLHYCSCLATANRLSNGTAGSLNFTRALTDWRQFWLLTFNVHPSNIHKWQIVRCMSASYRLKVVLITKAFTDNATTIRGTVTICHMIIMCLLAFNDNRINDLWLPSLYDIKPFVHICKLS